MAYPRVKCAQGNITTTNVNAGTVIVKPRAHQSVTVVDCWLRALGGAAGGATSVNVADSDGTAIAVFAVGGLTQNTLTRIGAANTTATNMLATQAAGKGLEIIADGTLTTATSVDYCVFYVVGDEKATA